MPKLALTREEAAQAIGCHAITISRLTERGLLRPSRATRRPLYTSETRTAAAAQSSSQGQQRPAVRERPVSFPSLDHDWDVPAFQRKQQ